MVENFADYAVVGVFHFLNGVGVGWQQGICNPLDFSVEDFNFVVEGRQEHDVFVIHLIW